MKMQKQHLGNTGLSVSRAGFGVLPLGPSQRNLPLEEGTHLLLYAMEQGFCFFDTAEYYQTYSYLNHALDAWEAAGGSRSDFVISSKSLASDYEGMMNAIEDALRQLHLDTIDIFLMHEVRSGQLEERTGAWQALCDAKKQGLVKAIGLSTHHTDIAASAAEIPELDVVFPLLNYAGLGIRTSEMSADGTVIQRFASAEEMMDSIRLCHAAGKGVFTMKAFGGGSLTADYQKALNYVFSHPEVDSVMIGFTRKSEVDDLLSWLNRTMPVDYNPDISSKRVRVNQEDCEGCGACRSMCSAGAIFWNPENGLAEVDQSKCLTCGYCIPACPVRAMIMY